MDVLVDECEECATIHKASFYFILSHCNWMTVILEQSLTPEIGKVNLILTYQ